MNDVAPHSGSRWEPPNGTLSQPAVWADPSTLTVAPSRDPEERDRRRRGPRAALVALLALLVMTLSGAWVAWGDQVRALVRPDSSAAPPADHGGGSQPWPPAAPGDRADGPGSRHHGDRSGADGDGPPDDHGLRGPDNGQGQDDGGADGGSAGNDGTSDGSPNTGGA